MRRNSIFGPFYYGDRCRVEFLTRAYAWQICRLLDVELFGVANRHHYSLLNRRESAFIPRVLCVNGRKTAPGFNQRHV